MKKIWMKIGELAGFKVEGDESVDYKAQVEELEKIQSALEEAKGYKEKHESAAADVTRLEAELKTAQDALATLKTEKEKVDADLATANTSLETANARVAELEAAAGEDPVNPGAGDTDPEAGVPSWVDPNADHYKELRSQGINLGF